LERWIKFDKTTEFHDFVRSLKPEELKGTYLAPETFFDPADIDARWKEVQHNTHGIYKDGKLYAIAVLGKSPFGNNRGAALWQTRRRNSPYR
jgi:hypothetical protein